MGAANQGGNRGGVREIENVWIPMSDGCRIAARMWLPAGAETVPVLAILEYIPYGNRDVIRLKEREVERVHRTNPEAKNHATPGSDSGANSNSAKIDRGSGINAEEVGHTRKQPSIIIRLITLVEEGPFVQDKNKLPPVRQ